MNELLSITGPTPPDSPIPSTGAFPPPPSGGPDLDDEFYAIASSHGERKRERKGRRGD